MPKKTGKDLWKIVFVKKAEKEFAKLPVRDRRYILQAIEDKLLSDADKYLIPLHGPFKHLYKFRVGMYRLICVKEKEVLCIVVVKVGHRKSVYN